MARIELTTEIRAPVERCFDLARDLDLHRRSMEHTREEAIAGRTSGLIDLGEEVTWRARHFGLQHEHTSRITAFERPRHFRDSMIRGRFARFEHDHFFEAVGTGTLMRDVVVFESPLGPIGWLVDRLVLRTYLEGLVRQRSEAIRREAEGHRAPGPETGGTGT
jgi:ligand-binding SRPBCC domain-containing protein